MNKLLPCPFCGSDDLYFGEDVFGFCIGCSVCYGRIGNCITKPNAIAAWNRRVNK